MKNIGNSGQATRPSIAAISAVAEFRGIDPIELERPLAEVIDTDALDALVRRGSERRQSSNVSVQFDFEGCRLRVHGNGTVDVEAADAA